ncbi:hypothetical protein CYY_003552 [Polysphondylium violaceum]|uniref:Thioredoxin domain-containing protein n=1 Tax=Polysphondylium violaceum TaxID=133409 RepID=A0A8J4PZ37_9MYCE|nr:hypothetical protein CYY_003552 [Polysphondylium violaceum]
MSTRTVTLQGAPVQVGGNEVKVGDQAKSFTLVDPNLQDITLDSYAGKRKVLNIFPSIDTPTCSTSVRKFNQKAAGLEKVVVLCISKDLPFAQARFCGAEGIKNCVVLSTFRDNQQFEKNYGVELVTGPLHGLLARAVIVLDENNKVVYQELVSEIAHEPNYDSAIASLN